MLLTLKSIIYTGHQNALIAVFLVCTHHLDNKEVAPMRLDNISSVMLAVII